MGSQKVSIRYLIDVAIGSPEPGIVNFNALYTVLQVISDKLALQDENIEIDSSFCPVSTNIFDSKSNVSSERLVDHQVFDFNSDTLEDRLWESKPKDSKKSRIDIECKKSPHRALAENEENEEQRQQSDDRKVIFEEGKTTDEELVKKQTKEAERLTNYRSELRQHIDALNARLGKIENIFATSVDVEQHVECLQKVVEQYQCKLDSLVLSVNELKEMRSEQERDFSACRKKLEHDKLENTVDEIRQELVDLKAVMGNDNPKCRRKPSGITNEEVRDIKNDYFKIQEQMLELRTTVCGLTEGLTRVEQTLSCGQRASSVVTVSTFEQEIAALRESIERTEEEYILLQHENQIHQITIEDLTSRLDDVTKTKIDKDDIEELLSEKADYTMLQRKVSVENMDAERRKVDKQITEITDCFVLNDEHVQKQISDIKKFLGDQSLEDMLYDFKVKVDKDIQVVRDAIRRLAEMKPDVDSATGRLRDLQCLSCDQDVVMKAIEMNNLSKFGDAYVTKSISPMITFEIGKLREAGKIGPPMDMGDALCDMARNLRHSGGMHTIVTNQDRVSKMKSHRHK